MRRRSLVGSVGYLLSLHIRKRPWLVGASAVVAVLLVVSFTGRRSADTRGAWSIGTFNIEFFPKHSDQIDSAFDLIAQLGVEALAVQEITDPDVFSSNARARLGESWEFVHSTAPADVERPALRVGVLYDAGVFRLRRVREWNETRVVPRSPPTLEVRLTRKSDGRDLRLFVIHLKATTEGRPIRRRQYAALHRILGAELEPGDHVVVMGDFNATEPGDRDDLRALADATGLSWATRELLCSAFWDRSDSCPTSRLDHVLSSRPPRAVEARGACQTHGCDTRDSCPVYRHTTSDHCPVVVSF